MGEEGKPIFTAVMAYNDYLATNLIKAFIQLGCHVPESMSVVGFDGVVPDDYSGPRITSRAIPLEALGAEASRMVYWRMEHPGAGRRRLVLETSTAEGDSVLKI